MKPINIRPRKGPFVLPLLDTLPGYLNKTLNDCIECFEPMHHKRIANALYWSGLLEISVLRHAIWQTV